MSLSPSRVCRKARCRTWLRHSLRQQASITQEPGEQRTAHQRDGIFVRDMPDKARHRAAQQPQDDIGDPASVGDGGLRTLVAQPREHRRSRIVPVLQTKSSLPQGLPVEGNAIDTETARLDHAEIGRVPSHCEKTPYPLQPIVVVVQRIRVDQEHQRRVLPFVYRLHHAQRGVSVAACRHQRRVGQKLRALVVKQVQGGRIGPEFGERSAHVSHRPRSLRDPSPGFP